MTALPNLNLGIRVSYNIMSIQYGRYEYLVSFHNNPYFCIGRACMRSLE